MSIFVRSLKKEEKRMLEDLARNGEDVKLARRAQVVLASHNGVAVSQIAEVLDYTDVQVRRIIHFFEKDGIKGLCTKYSGGHPPTFTEEQRQAVVELVESRPRDKGYPLSQWSLSTLQVALIKEKKVEYISRPTIRAILIAKGYRKLRTKTWKESKDPKYEKKNLIRRLYNDPPKGCRIICVDEFGPLEIRPYAGSCWAPTGKPQRLPATYTRYHGIRHLLAGLDLTTDNLFGVMRIRKRSKEFLGFLKVIRRRYPEERRLIIILDNFSTHRTKDNREWCRKNGVWMIPTATDASWMNRIESHFGAIHYFVLKNSYPKNHEDLKTRIKEHLKWRNKNRRDPDLLRIQNRIYVA